MRILFLTDNYPPEVNAPATRTHSHCREWVRQGAEVTVVTCVPNFPRGVPFKGYRNSVIQRETIDGVDVVRVWSFMAPNAGFTKRIADYLSFAATGSLASLFEACDVVVATSPQFFTALAASTVGMLKRKPWIFEVRDLWPESILATGAMRRGFLIDALERLELDLYRSAQLVVTVTHAFKQDLVRRGIAAGKVEVVTNGVDADEFANVVATHDRWPGGEGPFRVGYLGTHGLAHGLDVVLRAARLMQPGEVEFVLVGDGADKARLTKEAARLGASMVTFRDPVPRSNLPATMQEFDACLVPLRDSVTFRSVIPSKIFEAAAAGRPILLGVRGESLEIVERYRAGIGFWPEDEAALVAAIRRVRDEPGLYEELRRGGARLASDFDRRRLAGRMLELIQIAARVPRDSLSA
jgi:glycosyltransferase involved in cell wall biosynthesis